MISHAMGETLAQHCESMKYTRSSPEPLAGLLRFRKRIEQPLPVDISCVDPSTSSKCQLGLLLLTLPQYRGIYL